MELAIVTIISAIIAAFVWSMFLAAFVIDPDHWAFTASFLVSVPCSFIVGGYAGGRAYFSFSPVARARGSSINAERTRAGPIAAPRAARPTADSARSSARARAAHAGTLEASRRRSIRFAIAGVARARRSPAPRKRLAVNVGRARPRVCVPFPACLPPAPSLSTGAASRRRRGRTGTKSYAPSGGATGSRRTDGAAVCTASTNARTPWSVERRAVGGGLGVAERRERGAPPVELREPRGEPAQREAAARGLARGGEHGGRVAVAASPAASRSRPRRG